MTRVGIGSIVFLAAAVALGGQPALADDEVVVDMEDAAGDDHGPGDYAYPLRNDYQRGDLDLRRFKIVDEGDTIRFEVTLGRLEPLLEPRRSRAFIVPLDNEVTVQNVDIYLQRPGETSRVREAIPGRQLAFAEGDGWTRAVVFTPQPGYARHLLEPWAHAKKVIVPLDLQSIGRRVWARIPVAELGGRPGPGWGFAVAVSGALWENRFRFYRPEDAPDVVNVFTMPVNVVPGWRRFGGGDLSGAQPNVIDILAVSEDAQRKILDGYDPETRTWATLPMFRIRPPSQ